MRQSAWMLLIAAGTACANAQPTFELLPSTIGDLRALARGVSGDGQVIAGSTNDDDTEVPVVWRRQGGNWTLIPLPTEGPDGVGRALVLSHTGDVVGGMTHLYEPTSLNYGTPAIWRGVLSGSPTVETPLDEVPSQLRRGVINGLSADGAVAFANAKTVVPSSPRGEVWMYTQTGGAARISPDVFNGWYDGPWMCGNVLSADGSTLVGSVPRAGQFTPFFRWTSATSFVELPIPGGGIDRHGLADCISRDGRVIGGCRAGGSDHYYSSGARPVLWTEAGLVELPIASPNWMSRVLTLSADGRIAGGVQYSSLQLFGSSHGSNRAALWIDQRAYLLADYLTDRGVDLDGFVPNWLTGISDDGRMFVGFGSSSGVLHSFVVTIPACPADLTGEYVVDFADYLEFLNLFDALDPRADLNHDGVIDFADYLEFLNLFEAGC